MIARLIDWFIIMESEGPNGDAPSWEFLEKEHPDIIQISNERPKVATIENVKSMFPEASREEVEQTRRLWIENTHSMFREARTRHRREQEIEVQRRRATERVKELVWLKRNREEKLRIKATHEQYLANAERAKVRELHENPLHTVPNSVSHKQY